MEQNPGSAVQYRAQSEPCPSCGESRRALDEHCRVLPSSAKLGRAPAEPSRFPGPGSARASAALSFGAAVSRAAARRDPRPERRLARRAGAERGRDRAGPAEPGGARAGPELSRAAGTGTCFPAAAGLGSRSPALPLSFSSGGEMLLARSRPGLLLLGVLLTLLLYLWLPAARRSRPDEGRRPWRAANGTVRAGMATGEPPVFYREVPAAAVGPGRWVREVAQPAGSLQAWQTC